MIERLLSETSSTAQEPKKQPSEIGVATSSEPSALAKSGMWVAGLFLLAALMTAGSTGTATVGTYLRRRDEIVAESSTAEVERHPELLRQVESVFEQGADEFFQDGMHSNFSRSLLAMLARYGRAAFQAIAEYVFSGSGNPDVISEALRWLADFDDPKMLPQRWAILQRALFDRSPRIRDGAILGFAALDDPRARSLLLGIQDSEKIPELRRLIRQVIDQLNATHAAAAPQR